jgi:3-phenylpropionate/trans-cinnamate dioxygenase ferredoxin reductase subunit
MDHIVIIGAGQAAAQCAESLRRKGHRGAISLIGNETHLPYQRPPLSKKYLAGEVGLDRMLLRHQVFFAEHEVDVRLGREVTEVDRAASLIRLDDQSSLAYDQLVFATGASVRRLQLPGGESRGIHYLRTLADADHLRAAITPGQHALIVGGGYIGLEVAATLRQLGMAVTVLEMADRVMNRAVAEPVSRYYETEHRSHGVDIRLHAQLKSFECDSEGHVRFALTNTGRIAADLVVIGVGVTPNDSLARAADLPCENGILTDEYCRTADPKIWAIGDCSNHPSQHYHRHIRLESVDNAFEQAQTVAANLTGALQPHNKIPWFWSDQYHHKLLIVGLSQDHDQMILRGDPAMHSFSCCYLKAGELIAIDTVNMAKDQMAARKLIAHHARPNLNKLSDISIALKDCF